MPPCEISASFKSNTYVDVKAEFEAVSWFRSERQSTSRGVGVNAVIASTTHNGHDAFQLMEPFTVGDFSSHMLHSCRELFSITSGFSVTLEVSS